MHHFSLNHSFFMGVLSPVAILASLRWSSNSKQLKSKHFSSVAQGGNLIRSNCPEVAVQRKLFRSKYLDSNCPGRNFTLGQLPGWCFPWRELFGANCPAGKSPGDNYTLGHFHVRQLSGGLCSRGNYSGLIV